MLIHCARILTSIGSRAVRRDTFSLAHSAMLANVLLRQASSTTQVLVQWDSCIEKERIAANDSHRTCYHIENKMFATGARRTSSPKSVDSTNHGLLYHWTAGQHDVLKEFFDNFPMRNDRTCSRRNISHHRDTYGHSKWSHITSRLCAVCVWWGKNPALQKLLFDRLASVPVFDDCKINTSCVNFLSAWLRH